MNNTFAEGLSVAGGAFKGFGGAVIATLIIFLGVWLASKYKLL